MISTTYGVIGMTCEHCVRAVSDEIGAIAGVDEVRVALDAGGKSEVVVLSERPLEMTDLVAALDEAGDYTLA